MNMEIGKRKTLINISRMICLFSMLIAIIVYHYPIEKFMVFQAWLVVELLLIHLYINPTISDNMPMVFLCSQLFILLPVSYIMDSNLLCILFFMNLNVITPLFLMVFAFSLLRKFMKIDKERYEIKSNKLVYMELKWIMITVPIMVFLIYPAIALGGT